MLLQFQFGTNIRVLVNKWRFSLEMSAALKSAKALYDIRSNYKQNQLFELLKKGELSINDSEVKYNKIISAIIVTQEVLERANCEEKFEILMSFYMASTTSKLIDEDPDFYHEALAALSNLSFRELTVLYHLDEYQKKVSHRSEINYKPEDYIADKTHILIDDVYALFHRLLSSGLVIQCPLMGGYVRVYTSPIFSRIQRLITYDYFK